MLKTYNEVPEGTKTNLLIGNGFSTGISDKFNYTSLIDIAVKKEYIRRDDAELFSSFNTSNFESVLNYLSITKKVNKILSINSNLPEEKYNLLKQSLIKSVKEVHPKFDELNLDSLNKMTSELKKYKSIFTINYDLLLYWIMSRNDFKNFTDYFWSSDLIFDQFNTEIYHGNIPVHYLHGALFIYENGSFDICKIRSSKDIQLLESVENMIDEGNIPLFVSEGSSKDKLNKIINNSYLNFVFNQFYNLSSGLTIYGCAFNEMDQHIIDAINKGLKERIDSVAISIYTKEKNPDQINEKIDSYKSKFKEFLKVKNNSIIFFDHSTCPFNYKI